MKKLIVLPLLVAGTFAGTAPSSKSAKAPAASAKSAKSAKGAIMPKPSPNLYTWFAGGTAGYLLDSECEFFSGHVGRDLGHHIGGWDASAYLEVGYFGCDGHADVYTPKEEYKYDWKYDSKYESESLRAVGGNSNGGIESIWFDLDIIPVTLNYKLERELTRSLSAYVGAGAGVAFTELDSNFGNDDDVVFFAQAFAGVLHNVSDTVEVYAGGRVIYLEDSDFNLGGTSISSDQLGMENVDGLLEVGARINF